MEQVGKWILDHWSFSAFILAIFVQITPVIKWNPITWVGSMLLGSVRRDIDRIQRTIDDNEKDRIRWEVLDFANSCRNGRRHTKDEYQHIMALNDKYRGLLQKTGDVNGVYDEEYRYIMDLYADRQRKNDFL